MARILLVDDHEVVRRGIRTLLTVNGDWEVCGEAANGQEAIEKTLQLKPDLVLLDVSMPVMSGLDAAKFIRHAAPATIIVILSMHQSAQIANEARLAGADAYLPKACPFSEIHSTIAALVRTRPVATPR